MFTRQLATLAGAGVPLARALEVCRPEGSLGHCVDELVVAVCSGQSLSGALLKVGPPFSEAYARAVQAGEQSGGLILVLEQLARDLEHDDAFTRRLGSVLVYPAIMMGTSLVLGLGFLFVLMPVMRQLFDSLRMPLPLLTRLVLHLGDVLGHPLALVPLLLLPVSLWFSRASVKAWLNESELGLRLDGAMLRLPVIQKRIATRVLNAMALLLDSGLHFTQALPLLAGVAGNRAVAAELETARDRIIMEGITIHQALVGCRVFDRGTLSLLAAGEESARIPRMARSAARLCEMEADYITATLTALLEPVLMMFLGVVTAVLFVAVLLPVAALVSSVS
ncbi:MAG: type II secretion system F family protein [Candidatus Eremiobacterota bacterium]